VTGDDDDENHDCPPKKIDFSDVDSDLDPDSEDNSEDTKEAGDVPPDTAQVLKVLQYLSECGYGGKTVDHVYLETRQSFETFSCELDSEQSQKDTTERDEFIENATEFEHALNDLKELSMNTEEERRFSVYPVHDTPSLYRSFQRIWASADYGTAYVPAENFQSRTPLSTPVRRSKRLATKTPHKIRK